MSEPTLKAIGQEAEKRTQTLLDDAKAAVMRSEVALREITRAPYFTNGLASTISDAHELATKLSDMIEGLQPRIREHFNPKDEKE